MTELKDLWDKLYCPKCKLSFLIQAEKHTIGMYCPKCGEFTAETTDTTWEVKRW